MILRMMLALALITNFSAACDTTSKAGPYADLTDAEKARQALDNRDYTTAIEYYKKVVEANPTDYESYRFLSASYAGAGGFDIFEAVQATLSGAVSGASGESSPLEALGGFIPADPTEDQIENLRLAGATILSMPEAYRSYDHPENETASSAAQQLEFYQTAYSLASINKFAKVTEAGAFDQATLETMTVDDVDDILGSFEAIASVGDDSVMGQAAAEILAQIDAAPGESRRDKLIDFLNSQNAQP